MASTLTTRETRVPHASDDALNAICPYWTMFPLDFPLAELAGAVPGQWVLDPFCGRGTTLYAARKLGLPAVGIDSNPVAAAIAQAKLVSPAPIQIEVLASELLNADIAPEIPKGRFWELAYAQPVLRDLCRLREGLIGRTDSASAGLRAILLGALHGPLNKGEPTYFSNQMPRTYSTKPKGAIKFWEDRDMSPPLVDTLSVVRRHARRRYGTVPKRIDGEVWNGDAIEVVRSLRRRFTWIITSPPYPGMVTYRPDGWLREWLLGGPPAPNYARTNQLGAFTGEQFVKRLAAVWSAIADRCHPSARLTIRFGALPSYSSGSPSLLLLESLERSERWDVLSCRDAGTPPSTGARQADQLQAAGDHVREVDVTAVLLDPSDV